MSRCKNDGGGDLLPLILVCGYSGAGLSTVLNVFDDMGCCTIDNLPVSMLAKLYKVLNDEPDSQEQMLCLGVRIRSVDDVESFKVFREKLTQSVASRPVSTLFLSCDEDVLADRYYLSRRKHPLSGDKKSLSQAIVDERHLLASLCDSVDLCIDTTTSSPYVLRKDIEDRYGHGSVERKVYIKVASFGFKHGMMRPLDGLYDVRFLPNPYFKPNLRKKTGLDSEVVEFLLENDDVSSYIKQLADFHSWILPRFHDVSRHYYRVGIGCTGGQHRSVVIAEELAKVLKDRHRSFITVTTEHRDISVF